jgi:hypothetical protein
MGCKVRCALYTLRCVVKTRRPTPVTPHSLFLHTPHAPFPSLHSTFCYTLRSTLLRRLRSQHGKNTQDHCCCKLPSGSWIRSGSFFPRPKDLEFRSFLFYVHKEFMLTGKLVRENCACMFPRIMWWQTDVFVWTWRKKRWVDMLGNDRCVENLGPLFITTRWKKGHRCL